MEVHATGAALGAEVQGVDLSAPMTPALAGQLRDAWHQHLVLLVRGQTLDAQSYMNAISVFGKPQVGANRAYFKRAGRDNPHELEQFPEISLMTNLGPDGKPAMENEGLGSQEVVWHSDNSYIERPPAGSSLYALEIPPDGSGRTSFSNQYMALEELPPAIRQQIEGRCSKQDATRNSAGRLRPGVEMPERPEDVPGPMHPLIRKHPDTGRSALYLGRRRVWPSQYIEGYDNEASEALLDDLWAHATNDRYTWQHSWRVGDLLIWDNRVTLHFREPVNTAHRRLLWRSQFQGEDVLAA
ncbi:MAG: TauD/TfdA family dioxygenase [Pseudomonadota bacterium]